MINGFTRRSFLKQGSLSALPALLPAKSLESLIEAPASQSLAAPSETQRVFFINEGPFYRPIEFIEKLALINESSTIARDSFAEGGTVDALTEKFAEVTGKEAAGYVTSGTLANQLALSELSGRNSKVLVQEMSHVYRDEADAAETVFRKRLIPLGHGNPGFTARELEETIKYLHDNEAFESGIGAISIETPVRRADNRLFPVEEIRKISDFCRKNGYKLHLDGARLHIASAYTGISVKEYASYFDTVYTCLYKYLGATGGAVLCGEKTLIDRIPHLIKIHGGSVFTNWPNAAMALHHLDGIDSRMDRAAKKSYELFALLKQIPELKITAFADGTNTRNLKVSSKLDLKKFKDSLRENFITTGVPQEDGFIKIKVNETLLLQDNATILQAFYKAASAARLI